MSTASAERFACTVDGCNCDYARVAGLRAHQKKKHEQEFTKNGLMMKRFLVESATVQPTTDIKKIRTHEPDPERDNEQAKFDFPEVEAIAGVGADVAEATLTTRIQNLERSMEMMQSQYGKIQTELGEFHQLLQTSLSAAGKASADAVQPMLQELSSEVFAHVTDLRQQFTLLAKKSTRWCVVCFEQENNFMFLPCRHKCICRGCAENVIQKFRKCPICRETINKAIPVHDMSAWENE